MALGTLEDETPIIGEAFNLVGKEGGVTLPTVFAAEQIRDLDQWIAAENRSAGASIALRKLDYGEELDSGES